ncbi:hypothetical protein TOPH_03886 [Tolypocladium ophioglossoides CBS 100239]|uniref:C2H2-type domain-containing protein n=1 Tax=Tolypocladium ophioglossoides (strain CBS 100239) TaxID=1163406 RepID=A0A0L0NC02_TOLOC|nr:hypothetical protein TOPH_03886 [Tolypocladium ophioglossoides CBS 100239]
MDQSQNYQLQRPGLSPPSQLQQESSSSSPSQPQQFDATPQDVLAEARKNLQVLIDSGLSKEILHQWVDDSQSLQLSFPTSTQSFALSQPSLAPQHAPPPPPPQCPPPPPPSHVPSVPLGPNSVHAVAVSGPASTTTTPTVPSTDVKRETLPDDASRKWPTPTLSSNSASTAPERPTTTVSDADAAIFIPPSAPFSHSHRPRISISSVSSGSSGHASIWSTNSAQSSFSWHSGTTGGRSMAPLPMPPTSGASVLNSTHVAATPASSTRQNIYWCTSCETSFKRKYDWKRHEDEFHERWRKYPCPEPGCNRSFWGSNSFNQHHKQCHGCKTCPHAEKVVKFLRKRKYWACGFCSALHPARERHVEHVARHFESGLTKSDWMHSRVVYGLLHQPLIREAWDALVNSKRAEYGCRRPQFSWHPGKTGRAQGFLEKENTGQLQDTLEFFSGDEGEAQWIASSAYDLADIVLTSAPAPAAQFSGATAGMPPPPQFPQDPHATYPTLPPQPPHQSMLPSSSPNSQSPYASPFRATMFVPSQHQQFANSSRPSPDSASHSPLATSQSPLAPSRSHLEHRELPQLPSSSGPACHDGLMDFEYSPAPVVFDDWGSIVGSNATPQPPTAVSVSQAEWGMMHYFADPRVTS